ncbi:MULTISPECIES: S8 family serine peptidase [unclassified Methylobacterium]
MRELLTKGEGMPLILANSLAASVPAQQALALHNNDDVSLIELDPVMNPTLMDDAIIDVGLSQFQSQVGRLTGRGVRVAVLDSGVDTQHPYLAVAASVSVCGEDVALPGRHGTHCAGSIASKDTVFRGVAPDVDLLNVKVLKRDGSGQYTQVTKGIDAALDLGADVISLSLGFNHLPAWSDRGHGWACADGRCPLCTAIDNAVALGVIACVAAGNEHSRAESLRRFGYGNTVDTELGCPGQSRGAITVGALTKRTFLPADFSSRGPTAYGETKPDLAGPGVNVMSTVPVPRLPDGRPDSAAQRVDLFSRESGSSMATPIVAGAVALLLEHCRERGDPTTPATIKKLLLAQSTSGLAQPPNVVGEGRLDLARYGAIVPTT